MKSSITQSGKQRDDYGQGEILPIRRGGSGQAMCPLKNKLETHEIEHVTKRHTLG